MPLLLLPTRQDRIVTSQFLGPAAGQVYGRVQWLGHLLVNRRRIDGRPHPVWIISGQREFRSKGGGGVGKL